MRFERFMALRYLRGAEGHSEGRKFLRFITYVAVGGVALGVSALLLSFSIVRGFSREIQEKILGFGAHIQVSSLREGPLEEAGELQGQLRSFPQVTNVAPVVQDFVLLRRSADQIDGVVLWGTERLPEYLAGQVGEGRASFSPDSSGKPGMIVGAELARTLGIEVGDRVTAFSLRSEGREGPGESPSLARPRIAQFHVAGIYETSLHNYDELYAFVTLEDARALLSFGEDEVTRFDLTLSDVQQADSVAKQINQTIGFPIEANSIFVLMSGLFAWIALQESMIPLVIGIIVIVAAFNIVGTLLMVVLEKTREIGVLESMGASPRALRRMFLWLGLLIGMVGTAIGEITALLLAWVQLRFEIIPLPEEAYYMKTAPVDLNPLDFLIVAVVALALCAVASYIPARVASRIDPIQAIRFR